MSALKKHSSKVDTMEIVSDCGSIKEDSQCLGSILQTKDSNIHQTEKVANSYKENFPNSTETNGPARESLAFNDGNPREIKVRSFRRSFDEASLKYDVTMVVKSGVTRTPWDTGASGSDNKHLKFSPSNFSIKCPLLDKEEPPTSDFTSSTDLSSKKKPISTISGYVSAKKNASHMTKISLETYNNVRSSEDYTRGKAILCTTAIITIMITITLAVCILLAPKTLVQKPDDPPPYIAKIRGATKKTSFSIEVPKSTTDITLQLRRRKLISPAD